MEVFPQCILWETEGAAYFLATTQENASTVNTLSGPDLKPASPRWEAQGQSLLLGGKKGLKAEGQTGLSSLLLSSTSLADCFAGGQDAYLAESEVDQGVLEKNRFCAMVSLLRVPARYCCFFLQPQTGRPRKQISPWEGEAREGRDTRSQFQ